MKELTVSQLAAGAKGKLHRGNPARKVKSVCKDSNLADKDKLFIPLIGERYDAHRFIPQALERGCRCFFASDTESLFLFERYQDVNVILVKDTTEALQELAAWYLDLLNIKKIAITGSTGKTATKDLTWSVCSQKYRCEKNQGNFNNLIGVPMTILSFDEETEVGIIEMGMDRRGEIRRLAQIVRPDIGIITNIGTAHIERLGSQEEIFKAKMELVQDFDSQHTLIFSEGGPFLTRERVAGDYQLITTGTDEKCNYFISNIDDFGIEGIQFTLQREGEVEKIKLELPGWHNALNGALAAAAGGLLGISLKAAAAGLMAAELSHGEVSEKNGITVIDDTYNAAPISVKNGIDTLVHSKADRTVAILGDMYELGDLSKQQHKLVGAYAGSQGVDVLLVVGEDARYIKEGAEDSFGGILRYYETKEQLLSELSGLLCQGDLVLVKGSRGMAMEEIVKEILK